MRRPAARGAWSNNLRFVRLGLLASLLIAVVATWPAAIDPGGAFIGHPGNDVWNHVWGFWWVGDELSNGRFPLYTDLLRFPGRSSLYFIDTVGAVATLPIQWVAGVAVAYNFAVFSCFFVAAFGAWLLCRYLLQHRTAYADEVALLGAIAYGLSPHLMAQAYNGISETLTAGSLPLTTWAFLRLLDRPKFWRAVALGALAGSGMLANWYYGLFGFLAAMILGIGAATTRWERIHWRWIPGVAVLGAALALTITAPGLLAFAASLEGPEAIVNRDPEFVWKSLVGHNMTDAVSMFRPGKVYSPDLKALHGEELLIVVYLGWTLLAGAALGLWAMPRWRDRLPWLAWLAFFSLMTLGPYLFVAGEYVTIDDRRIPLPFLAFFDAVPLFDRISHPFRFVMPVQLGLAALACIGLAYRPRAWAWAASALVAVEFLLLSPAPWPLARSSAAIPAFCETLAADPEPGAVLDLPMALPNLERAIYHYWQTAHRRPSPYSLNEPNPLVLDRSRLARTLGIAEAGRLDRLPPLLAEFDLVVSGRNLADLGFRYVVLHARFYLPERLASSLTILRVALGDELEITAEGDHVWRLERPVGHGLAQVAP